MASGHDDNRSPDGGNGAVLLRCNASASIGMGHLMRCREVARDLVHLGYSAVLMGPPTSLQRAGDDHLFTDWLPVSDRGTTQQDFDRVVAACRTYGAKWLIMDDYRADADYHARLRSTGLRWMHQFDASRPHAFQPDLLVNASPFERRAAYAPWLVDPDHTQTLFGPSFAVLRPEFTRLVARKDGRAVKRIFIGFGGGDDQGAFALAVDALVGQIDPQIELCFVTGQTNPRLAMLEAALSGRPSAELFVQPPDMAGLMADCDLAIIGGGTMSYECAICGLPMILIAIAGNQINPALGWQDLTGARYLGTLDAVSPDALRAATLDLIDDDEARRHMAAVGRAHVDGRGTRRLTSALLGLKGEEDE